MKQRPAKPTNARIAVIQHAANAWRVLIADVNGRRPSVVAADTLATEDELRTHLAAAGAQEAVVVVPADSIICRTSTLPSAEPEQLAQALRLQAEAQISASTPVHRLGTAVLPAATGETNRMGMILAWPETAAFRPPALELETSFAPGLAGLAAVLDDQRPAEALLWIDRRSGGIGLALSHANGASFRGTREAATSDDEWAQHVARALFETGVAVGHNDAFLESLAGGLRDELTTHANDPAVLLLPREVIEHAADRLDGVPRDSAWWRTYGIAAGVVLAVAGPLSGLTTMQEAPAIETPSRWQTMATGLSRRDTAMMTVVACLLLLALVPLVASGARLGILKMRYPDIEEQVAAVDAASYQLDMYRELRQEAWPMTKLISDIVSNAPEGVKIETIRVQPGSERFVLTGTVLAHEDDSARRVANQMETNFLAAGLFAAPAFGWGESSLEARDFNFSMRITRPYARPRYDIEQDFARWPLADRKANKPPPEDEPEKPETKPSEPADDAVATREPNDDARSTPAPSEPVETDADDADDADDEGEDDGGRSRRRPVRTSNTDTARRSDTDERMAGSAGAIIAPEPLTEAQINAMSTEELKNHLSLLAPLRNQLRKSDKEEDQETHVRVEAEWDMILARLRDR